MGAGSRSSAGVDARWADTTSRKSHGLSDLRHPKDSNTGRTDRNGDQVDSRDPQTVGEAPYLVGLGPGEGVGGIVQSTGLNRLDLDGCAVFSIGDHYVDLTPPDPHVSGNDLGLTTDEKANRERFTDER